MATQIAQLGIKIESGDIKKATEELKRMEDGGSKAEKSTRELKGAYSELNKALGSPATKKAIDDIKRLEKEGSKTGEATKELKNAYKTLNKALGSPAAKKARENIERIEKATKKAEAGTKKLTKASSGLGAALSALSFGIIARQLLQQVNTYQALTNQLKLVTTSTEELAEVQDDLFQVAQETRGSFEGTVSLYARLSRATKTLDLADGDLLSVTKAVNQAVSISGATAQSAAGALFQLGQGLGAGALRGEELNSVLEGTPRLANAIADGLGVTIKQLRVMGAEGALNAEKVVNALKNQASVLESEFAGTTKTLSQAFIQLENVALQTFGSLDATDLVKSMDEFRAIISDEGVIGGLQTIAGVMLDIVGLGVKAAAGWGMIFQLFTDERTEITKVREEMAKIQEQIVSLSSQSGRGREDRIFALTKEFGGLANQLKELTRIEKERNDASAAARPNEDDSLARAMAEQQIVADSIKTLTLQNIQTQFEEEQALNEELRLMGNALALADLETFENEKTQVIQRGLEIRAIASAVAAAEEQRTETEKQAALKSIAMAGLGNLSTLMSSESKKQFNIGKVASISSAVIAGYDAAVNSYKAGAKVGGPVLGAAFAATSVLATNAQIQKIRSTSFGGGGSTGGAVGGGGVGNVPQQVGPINPSTLTDETQQSLGSLTINITGGLINEEFLNDQLIPQIQDSIDQRDVILIRQDSLNGILLNDQT